MKTRILKLSVSTTVLALLAFSHTTYAADSGRLISKEASKCLDVPGATAPEKFLPNLAVQIFTCHGEPNQQWTFEQISQQIQSRGDPSLCLSKDDASLNVPTELNECFVLPGTGWGISQNQFVNGALGQCIDRNGATIGRLRVATCSSNNTSANQKFVVDSFFRIRATATNACWDVPNGDREDPFEAAPIQLFPCHNGINQKWVISEGGVIRYQRDETFCVAIDAHSNLALSQECGTTAVQWVIRGPLVSKFNSECLQPSSDGTVVWTRPCNGQITQRWDYWP
jgi:hypothetical protein